MSIKLLAPNGKQSNLNAEQYELVRSSAFKKWFSNSKVNDKRGNPLEVYHGSPDLRGLKEKYIFESRFADNQSFFFTDNFSMAKSYADPQRAFDYQNAEEGVIGLYLSLQNPLIVNAFNQIWRKFETTIDANKIIGTRNLIKFAKNKGYDGVIVENVRDYYNVNEQKTKGGNVYVAFEPNQIKLADGTNTMFDINSDDIRYVKGGKVNGDCYLVAGQMAMKIYDKKINYIGTPYLVHAEVRHSKIENLRYGHAFIEDDENVYDFSNNRKIIMPKQIYYYFGDINPKDKNKYKKYNFKQAKEKMLSTGNYGCWDIKVDFSNGGKIVNGCINEMPNYLKIILGFNTAGQI